MARKMIVDPNQMVGGTFFIEVMCLHNCLIIIPRLIVGQPYIRIKGGDNIHWFFREKRRLISSGESIDDSHSLMDINVIPNSFNDHSLWRFDSNTLRYLTTLKEKGAEGITEYLALLAEKKRGESYHRRLLRPFSE